MAQREFLALRSAPFDLPRATLGIRVDGSTFAVSILTRGRTFDLRVKSSDLQSQRSLRPSS